MRYLHWDVFTDTPFEGNQLAVVPQPAPGLTTDRMQRIANEMAFSETTFVLPKEADGDVRMRIFTPASELPMAGHPTIGTTFALAHEGRIEAGRGEFVFECGVGPIPVELEWRGSDGRLSFAWMTQPLPSFADELQDRDAFTAAVGVKTSDLHDLPLQVVSCGLQYLMVPLESREAVDRVAIDRRGLARVYERQGLPEIPIYVFTLDRTGASGEETVYSRMLAPSVGIAEDPATGSACGPLGSYLFHHGVTNAERARSVVNLQGAAMKRPSRIHISLDTSGGEITRVRVGGTAVLVALGEIVA